MNWTRAAIVAILGSALVAGVSLYYLQVYAYYVEVTADDAGGVTLVRADTGEAEAIEFTDFTAIDSDSSPIRFRACFRTALTPDAAAETYVADPDAVPLNAPGWFDCFDARAIGGALESGDARAFLVASNVHYGIDRVAALFADGRGYMWHQINHCGEVVFDGEPAPEDCPPVPEGLR